MYDYIINWNRIILLFVSYFDCNITAFVFEQFSQSIALYKFIANSVSNL
jgi:hypothetical protein